MSTQTAEAWVPTLPAMDSFGNRLRLLRFVSDEASVVEMATRCGVPVVTWRTWERGATPRNMAKIVRQIHDATGVDMSWMMWGATPVGGGDLHPGQERWTVRSASAIPYIGANMELAEAVGF